MVESVYILVSIRLKHLYLFYQVILDDFLLLFVEMSSVICDQTEMRLEVFQLSHHSFYIYHLLHTNLLLPTNWLLSVICVILSLKETQKSP